jgi:hypothetical protein
MTAREKGGDGWSQRRRQQKSAAVIFHFLPSTAVFVEPKIFLSAPVPSPAPAPDSFIRYLENYLFGRK